MLRQLNLMVVWTLKNQAMTNKPTKPYDWNRFVKHGAKVLNEEAGVTSPASAAKNKKPYYVSINGNLTDVNNPEYVTLIPDNFLSVFMIFSQV